MSLQKQKIICLMGPTASGKTALAEQLIQNFPLDIISVDSALVYRDMNIGTAKPDQETLARAPHALIDICDPSQVYSVADFMKDVMQQIHSIHQKNRIPLLVGGTMMYFHALQNGLSAMPEGDEDVRSAIQKQAKIQGWPVLHEQLKDIDPNAAERIKPTDAQRISRALEVFQLTGTPISQLQKNKIVPLEHYDILNLALLPNDRSVLHSRIATRFDEMLSAGFIDEVKTLYQREDLHAELPSMRAVGYRQAWQMLEGKFNAEEFRERGIAATRQLAKRQITWLRNWPGLHAFDADPDAVLSEVIQSIRKYLQH